MSSEPPSSPLSFVRKERGTWLATLGHMLHTPQPVDKSPERPPADAAELASWLRELHEKSGLSNRKLAAKLETDEKNVYRWLGIGSHKPSAPGGIWLLKILNALGVQMTPAPPDS